VTRWCSTRPASPTGCCSTCEIWLKQVGRLSTATCLSIPLHVCAQINSRVGLSSARAALAASQLRSSTMPAGSACAHCSEVEKESPSGGWLRHMRVWRTLVRVSSWRGLVVAGMQRIARTAIWRAHVGSFATAVASFRRGRSVHASIRRQPHIMLCAKANHSVAALTFSRPRTTNRVSP